MVETFDGERKRLEREDYGHELAGLETGRTKRFGVGATRAQDAKNQQRKERAYRDVLDYLLATDPEYLKLYQELGEELSNAETEAERAIRSLETALTDQQNTNNGMRDQAPKIDGQAVFRMADGRVLNEDGHEVDVLIAEGIVWPDNAPRGEDYFEGVKHEAELQDTLNSWNNYRNETLGDIRNRYDDRDAPMDKGGMQDALKAIEQAMPEPTSSPAHNDMAVKPDVALNAGAFPSFDG
ncbi:MAG: hypothetical protein ACSHXB_17580 [Sulfitobacter sp.]